MAKVFLIHKDKDISILDHSRTIALLNTVYQLINIIIRRRLKKIAEKCAMMEGSQYGFQAHRELQIVVQRAHWAQQQAMKQSGTLIQSWTSQMYTTQQGTPVSGQFCEAWEFLT